MTCRACLLCRKVRQCIIKGIFLQRFKIFISPLILESNGFKIQAEINVLILYYFKNKSISTLNILGILVQFFFFFFN